MASFFGTFWTTTWGEGDPVVPGTPPDPLPVPSPWQGITATWTGWDGSVWPITEPASGVFLLNDGIRGMHMPKATKYKSQSPTLHGSQFRGYRFEDRDVFWPLYLYSDTSSIDWLNLNEAFWRTMQPGKTGLWTVTRPDGKSRAIELSFEDDSDWADVHGAVKSGWATYPIRLTAEQPLWMGEPITQTFGDPASDLDFYGGPTDDYVFYLSSSSSFDTAVIANPGDEPVRPVWRTSGPHGGVTVGLAGRLIEVPALLAGESRVIDTRPEFLAMFDQDGNEVTDELADTSDFTGSIPPGLKVELSVEMVSPGAGASVSVTIVPLFHRAY